MFPRRRPLLLAFAACAGLALAACSTPSRLPAVPVEAQSRAVVLDAPGARYRPEDRDRFMADIDESLERERTDLRLGDDGELPPVSYLAISGGGQDGAFGAGLLAGWTARGDRPEFKIVTGVSTGALIAPFAFLGPGWDAALTRLYTEVTDRDLIVSRGVSAALFDDAMADNLPLQRLVEAQVTPQVLDAIARESRRGRILLVATTDLDARASVVWNLTKMAESGRPEAVELVRRILVASAAIPGELPPTMIDVEVEGKRYHEMHVDGGTTQQVFVVPPEIVLSDLARRERTFYVIRNDRRHVPPVEVERSTIAIARRAIASLIHTQAIGDLYEIAAVAARDQARVLYAYIPDDFAAEPRFDFDNRYMNELFATGFRLGRDGYPWSSVAPGMEAQRPWRMR